MLGMIGVRLVRLVGVLFLVTLATFFMIDLIPGDPASAILGPNGTTEQYEQIREELGLNEPVVNRYVDWLGSMVQGDLGQSLIPPHADVTETIRSRMSVTLQLVIMATAMALLAAIPLALAAAYRAGGRLDRAASGAAFAAISMPAFLIGLLLVFFVVFHRDMVRWGLLGAGAALALWLVVRTVASRADHPPGGERTRVVIVRLLVLLVVIGVTVVLFTKFPEFPRQGFSRLTSEDGIGDNLRHAFLPALTLAINEIAIFMRLLRSDLITTLKEDYILAARAKGMPSWRILVYDALRPSSFSLMTVAGLAFARLIGGTVIVEAIFNVPGMGTLVVESIGYKDVRVVQSAVLVIAVFYVLVNLLVDLSYSYLDPRLRRRRS